MNTPCPSTIIPRVTARRAVAVCVATGRVAALLSAGLIASQAPLKPAGRIFASEKLLAVQGVFGGAVMSLVVVLLFCFIGPSARVNGADLREIKVPASNPRGGFLTQAAVLKVTANGTATSPVLRGAWVTERLLGLRALLLADEDALARNFARQLLIYATGAGIRFSDRPAIEAIVAKTKPSKPGIRSLVQEVVASELFQTK